MKAFKKFNASIKKKVEPKIEPVTYDREELISLINKSETLTASEKVEFLELFSSNEDVDNTGATLYKILKDEQDKLDRVNALGKSLLVDVQRNSL